MALGLTTTFLKRDAGERWGTLGNDTAYLTGFFGTQKKSPPERGNQPKIQGNASIFFAVLVAPQLVELPQLGNIGA